MFTISREIEVAEMKNIVKKRGEKKPSRLAEAFSKNRIRRTLGQIFIYVLLIEIAFVILFPLLSKFSASLMSSSDMYDRTVIFIPRMFSFSWQWTDTFYSGMFFSELKVLSNTIFTMTSAFHSGSFAGNYSTSSLLQTGVLMAIIPLVIIYIFAQRKIIGGIERSGLVG